MKANQVKSPPSPPEPEHTCLVCGKTVRRYYGTWGLTPMTQGVTCSRECEKEQERRSSFFFDGRI